MSNSSTLASASPARSYAMPNADEIIAAFEVPSDREAEVREVYVEYLSSVDADRRQQGRQPTNLLEPFYVPPSRSYCASADRLRSFGQVSDLHETEPRDTLGSASTIGTVISRGRWRLLLDGLETGGAVALAAALRTEPRTIENLCAHTLAGALLGLSTEPKRGDEDVQDEAAGRTIWLSTVLSNEQPDPVDEGNLLELETLLGASGIDLREASALMSTTLELVDRDGPYLAPERGHEAAVTHVWSQMTMQTILDHALSNPAAAARHEDRLERRRAERAAERITAPRVYPKRASSIFRPCPASFCRAKHSAKFDMEGCLWAIPPSFFVHSYTKTGSPSNVRNHPAAVPSSRREAVRALVAGRRRWLRGMARMGRRGSPG